MERGDPTYNLACSVHRHSQSMPQALALACEGQTLSYGELARQSAMLAAWLAGLPDWPDWPDWPGASGTQPRVAILASRSAAACVAVLGAAWAGATYVPIGLKLPQERILAILAQCRPDAVVADAEGAALLSDAVLQAAPPCICIAGAPPQSENRIHQLDMQTPSSRALPLPAPMDQDATAYIIFTSGTTGVPKGVMVPARAIRNYIGTVTAMLGLQPSDRATETCELSFDVSLHNMFCTWEAGASLHVLPPARIMNAVRFARENGITVWNSVPSLVGMLRQVRALAPASLPGVRLAVFGGEQLPGGAVAAWRVAAPSSVIHNFYGPTEATVYCLCQVVGNPVPMTPGRDVVAIGRAIDGTEAAILDGEGRFAGANCPGELLLGGVQLASGYLNAPQLTSERFITIEGKRWYRTGDIAMRADDGVYHWLGRADNQVKVLGHRVELEEIDAHLRLAADADMVATVAWPVTDGAAQGLVAFIGAQLIDDTGIAATLKSRLPHYMIPGRILPMAQMPLNSNGKVDRKALRTLLEGGMA